jgi:hypothetical protein
MIHCIGALWALDSENSAVIDRRYNSLHIAIPPSTQITWPVM